MIEQKPREMKIVIVGFNVKTENSIIYRKLDTPSDLELGSVLNKAFHDKDCDFVSVRRILK